MSRAFVKEDVDPPERSGRRRATSGLPPGATNYITASGAARLEEELAKSRRAGDKREGTIAELERILAAVTVVHPPEESTKSIAFGARVTVLDSAEHLKSYRIVGVDELDFYADAVSWISPIGKTLLAAEPGDSVNLAAGETVRIVEVDYPTE
jgi:transcription elongation GreA/GreB family factor